MSCVHSLFIVAILARCSRAIARQAVPRNSIVRVDQQVSQSSTTSIEVELFYETRCPYSITWLNQTLRTVWEDAELRGRMSLVLYPYGNAHQVPEEQVSAGYHFWHETARYPLINCQHGEDECFGNFVQACAYSHFRLLAVDFAICMASYGTGAGPELSSYACGTSLGINMTTLKDCVRSDAGHEMMLRIGSVSDAPALNRTYVPWLMINEAHSILAEGNLVAALCQYLPAPKPAACAATSNLASTRSMAISSSGITLAEQLASDHRTYKDEFLNDA